MQRFRIVGLCLVALFALSAVAATGASAFVREAPEVGRCVKKTGGKWKDGGCKTKAVPGEEKFEWQPAFEPGNKYNEEHPLKLTYTSVSKPETNIQLETTGVAKDNPGKVKSVVKCTGESSKGVVTGPKASIATAITFTGCESSGLKCKSAAAAEGEIKVHELEGLLGWEKISTEGPAKNKVANEFTPTEGAKFVEFNCGGIAVGVKGHVLNPITANKMLLQATVKFAASGGKQKPEKFANTGTTKLILESAFSNIGTEFEQSGQTLTTIQKNAEKLEVSTIE
jgi:hypothetical protein